MWNEKDIADVAGISNEDGRASFYAPPSIRQSGKNGEFTLTTKSEDGKKEETLPKKFEVVFLKHRSQIAAAFSPGKVKKPSYFTTEFDNPNELVEILKLDNGKVESIAQGVTTKSAFDQIFQLTKLTPKNEKVIYVLRDGEVNRLHLKGGSMGPYFDYLKEVKTHAAHSFMVVTEISDSGLTENEAGLEYHHMLFKVKGESDPAVVSVKMREVDANLVKAAPAKNVKSNESASADAAWAAISEEIVQVD
jgi:hypothetical protein